MKESRNPRRRKERAPHLRPTVQPTGPLSEPGDGDRGPRPGQLPAPLPGLRRLPSFSPQPVFDPPKNASPTGSGVRRPSRAPAAPGSPSGAANPEPPLGGNRRLSPPAPESRPQLLGEPRQPLPRGILLRLPRGDGRGFLGNLLTSRPLSERSRDSNQSSRRPSAAKVAIRKPVRRLRPGAILP